jgi:hypothetical protein
MATRVTRDQFEVTEEVVIHRPTGMKFIVRAPEQWPKKIEWRHCSFHRGDYRGNAILEVAKALIEERANKTEPV